MRRCSSSDDGGLRVRRGGWVAPGLAGLVLETEGQDAALSTDERDALRRWTAKRPHAASIRREVPRLCHPLDRVRKRLPPRLSGPRRAWTSILFASADTGRAPWALPGGRWTALMAEGSNRGRQGRPYAFCHAWALSGYEFTADLATRVSAPLCADLVFGRERVRSVQDEIEDALIGLGYDAATLRRTLPSVVATLMLTTRSADLASYTEEALWSLQRGGWSDIVKRSCGKMSRALSVLGHLPEPIHMRRFSRFRDRDTEGIAPEWVALCHRWRETSAIGAATRQSGHGFLLRTGLWLADKHPEVRRPSDWTPDIAARAVRWVTELRVGEYALASAPPVPAHRRGKPMMVNTRCAILMHLRRFFFDVEAWGWETLRFDPHRHLATPTRILRQRGPNPRVVDDRVWLKLVWASLNLTEDDHERGHYHPFALVRAVGIVWTHAGLRKNEIARLRVGCSRPQAEPITAEDGAVTPAGAVSYLTVPPGKTAREFVKPVAPVVHEAIEAWAARRPDQPDLLDGKTGERVPFLFSHRGKPIGQTLIDRTVIPALCRKAGVAEEDSRGRITSHRARSSALTALANAREGLSLPELMSWAGHACARSTMHYLAIKPTRLAATFAKADRMAHMVAVLVDHDAVVSGDAARGAPYKFYDLGDSYCTNPFWSTCPHRMACARCDFNLPKASARGLALEARGSLQRLLEEVPLTDDERAAAEGDEAAVRGLIAKLDGEPTPDGRTRDEIEAAEPAFADPNAEAKIGAPGRGAPPARGADRPTLSARGRGGAGPGSPVLSPAPPAPGRR